MNDPSDPVEIAWRYEDPDVDHYLVDEVPRQAIESAMKGLVVNDWRIVRFDPTTVEQGPLIITDEWKPQ